jgi:hypothetical protein
MPCQHWVSWKWTMGEPRKSPIKTGTSCDVTACKFCDYPHQDGPARCNVCFETGRMWIWATGDELLRLLQLFFRHVLTVYKYRLCYCTIQGYCTVHLQTNPLLSDVNFWVAAW